MNIATATDLQWTGIIANQGRRLMNPASGWQGIEPNFALPRLAPLGVFRKR
jgi:hypothetical protein